MKDTYQKALLVMFHTTDDSSRVLAGFKQTLERRGHERLYVPVLRAVLRVLEAEQPVTRVRVARDGDSTAWANEIATTLKELGATGSSEAEVDESLIGGYVVEHNHTRLDNSYKTKLVRLYRSLTT